MEIQAKKQVRRFTSSKLVLLILLILIVSVGRGAYGMYLKYAEATAALSVRETAFETLSDRQETLANNLADLDTTRGQEAIMRSTYMVAKPGEEVIILVPNKETDDASKTSDKKDWWSNIVKWWR